MLGPTGVGGKVPSGYLSRLRRSAMPMVFRSPSDVGRETLALAGIW